MRTDIPAAFYGDGIGIIDAARPGRDLAVAMAKKNLVMNLDSIAAVERMQITGAQIQVILSGISAGTDPQSVWRMKQLVLLGLQLLRDLREGKAPELRTASRHGVVEGFGWMPPARRAVDFIARAAEVGADATDAQLVAGAFLAHHGHPWVFPTYQGADDYRRGLVMASGTGDGTVIADELAKSIGRMMSA